MNHLFLLRLALDFIAAGLLLAALAYWWLDNAAHELIGTGMFLLLVVHNLFNRRWYGTLGKTRREARGLITVAANLSLLAAMVVLLVTSVMISRSLFGFLALEGGVTARQLHILAAYWALVIAAIHLGLHWSIIMAAARGLFGITARNAVRTAILRIAAIAIAACGIHSSFIMGIGSKLGAEVTIDFWDFEASTAGFFLHHMAIVGLYVLLAHYTGTWLRNRKRANDPAAIVRPSSAGQERRLRR